MSYTITTTLGRDGDYWHAPTFQGGHVSCAIATG
jgi:hypothetical protein